MKINKNVAIKKRTINKKPCVEISVPEGMGFVTFKENKVSMRLSYETLNKILKAIKKD